MPTSTLPASRPLAIPTAMHDDGSLDLDAQMALAATVAASGADGVVVLDLGSREVLSLDTDERRQVVAASRRGAAGLPLLVGTGAPGGATLTSARRAADAGADALLVPIGGRPDQRGDLLAQVAALGVPLVLQHHPGVTGTQLPADELATLAGELEAAVVHEASPVPDGVAALVAADVAVLGGLGGLFLPEELDAGASGSAAATAVPEHLTAVLDRHRGGDAGGAREAHLLACGYLRLEAGSLGTVVRKEAWRQRGLVASGRVREGAPLGAATKAAITRRLRELGVELRAGWPSA